MQELFSNFSNVIVIIVLIILVISAIVIIRRNKGKCLNCSFEKSCPLKKVNKNVK